MITIVECRKLINPKGALGDDEIEELRNATYAFVGVMLDTKNDVIGRYSLPEMSIEDHSALWGFIRLHLWRSLDEIVNGKNGGIGIYRLAKKGAIKNRIVYRTVSRIINRPFSFIEDLHPNSVKVFFIRIWKEIKTRTMDAVLTQFCTEKELIVPVTVSRRFDRIKDDLRQMLTEWETASFKLSKSRLAENRA